MLEFVLVRLYGGAHLLWKMIVYCQNAGGLCVQRIKLGHFWNIGLNNLSCVSRLWTLWISMLVLVEKTYKCFNCLLPVMPVSQLKWLAIDCNYKFPQNIAKEILDDESAEESFFDKFKNIVTSNNFPEFVTNLADPTIVKNQITLGLSIDVGEVINREDLLDDIAMDKPESITNFTKLAENSKVDTVSENKESNLNELNIPCSNKKWEKLNCKSSLHTKNSSNLELFVQEENKLRKTNRNMALTKTLVQDEWKMLRGELNDYIAKIHDLKKNKKREAKLLRKSKTLLMCWVLYPNLKGRKPDEWKK